MISGGESVYCSMPVLLKLLLLLLLSEVRSEPCSGLACLQDYVARPEPSYRWEDLGLRLEGEEGDWTGYVLNFTSQQWLTPAVVSR